MIPLTGIGYDVHKLVEGRKLILGGVEIPHVLGLLGHSDADVVCHAIADALLGAVSAGDIGKHFPPSDESIRGINSLEILRRSVELVKENGGQVVNVDATVIAERPKINPHVPAMRKALAEALGLAEKRVSIKATTNETLGFAGREEGIAALAVATVLVDS